MEPGSAEAGLLDRFELDLRKVPGVIAAGFTGRIEDLVVHLTVATEHDVERVTEEAGELVRLYVDRPVAFDVVAAPGTADPPRGRSETGGDASVIQSPARAELSRQERGAAPPLGRVALLGVRVTQAGKEVEVHLTHRGVHAVGRGAAGGPAAAALAALQALDDLGWLVPFTVRTAVRLAVGIQGVVAVSLHGAGGERFGLSRAPTVEEAAVKATLQALNRYLADPRHGPHHPGTAAGGF